MNTEKTESVPIDFPFDIEDDLGSLIDAEFQCPGVYYVANEGDGQYAKEFYVVDRDTHYISDAAKAYGRPLAHHPDLLVYRIDDAEGGKGILKYEIARWRKKQGLSLPEGETLRATALFAMEYNPEYFGSYPAPVWTPRGGMTRYRALANGIFILETDLCERLVAVSYPVWDAALSEYTARLGMQTEDDRRRGIHTTLGCLFFTEQDGCLALFELLPEFPQILESGLVDAAALNNAIWHYHGDYAALFNRGEQEGLHDALSMLLQFISGEEPDPSVHPEHLIALHLDAGINYLRF